MHSEKFGWENAEVLATYQGKELNHIVTEHPWDPEVDELVILGEHVTLDSGTGIVHTAPGFGVEDFDVCHNKYPEVGIVVPVDSHNSHSRIGQACGKRRKRFSVH